MYKVPYNLKFYPTPIFFKILIFFPKISFPFPSPPLVNLPYSLNNKEQMIYLPLILFLHVIFLPKAFKFLSLLHKLIFFPKGFVKLLPPPHRVGNEELYTPLSNSKTPKLPHCQSLFTIPDIVCH